MRKHAFTLVELLVVIGIIGVLIAILMPTLRGVRDVAQRTACLSNLRQLGTAMQSYIAENKGSFPYCEFWYNVSGKKGNMALFGLAPFDLTDKTGLRNETGILAERPLNEYLGQSGRVSSCPNDLGDAKKPAVTNCYDAYGTSYQAQWHDVGGPTAFGVVPVLGAATLNVGGGRTMIASRPAAKLKVGVQVNGIVYKGSWSQKIVLGDFNWHGNRPITDARVLWHRPSNRNVRQQNMLFGDGHAEFFTFPTHYGDFALPVNASANTFW